MRAEQARPAICARIDLSIIASFYITGKNGDFQPDPDIAFVGITGADALHCTEIKTNAFVRIQRLCEMCAVDIHPNAANFFLNADAGNGVVTAIFVERVARETIGIHD